MMDPKLQQLLMLLSGTSQGGLTGGPMLPQATTPNPLRLTGGLNSAASPQSSMNSGYSDQANNGDNGRGDGKGDGKPDDTGPDLSALMQQWRNAVDQGPSGYTYAMRQNLGMNDQPYNSNLRSGMAANNFMDLFMGKNFGQGGNGNDRSPIGAPGSDGHGFNWRGDNNNNNNIYRGGPGSEGPGFQRLGINNGGNNRGGPGSEGPGFRPFNDNGGNGGGTGRPTRDPNTLMHPLNAPAGNTNYPRGIVRPGA